MKNKLKIPACESCQSRVSSIFGELKNSDLTVLSENKCGNLYTKGQMIFYEGNKPTGLFCINHGKVKVYKMNEQGKEQIVRLAKDGDVIGYRSLVSGTMYHASASVLEDAVICYIPKSHFTHLLQSNVDLSMKTIRLLSHDLQLAEKKVSRLAQNTVRERLAESLLGLKEFSGVEDDGATISISLSREEMANIVGTATETVIRLLSEFNHEKLIELSGRKIKILNLTGLVRAANLSD